MSEREPESGDGEKARNIDITPGTGSLAGVGEGLGVRVHGPNKDGIRVSDSRGWTAGGDISDGMVEAASASGIPSEGEDLTLDTAEFLVRRLNRDGATWGPPVLLQERVGGGVDFEARDIGNPSRPPLQGQVTRPKMPAGFWKGISLASKAEVPPGAVEEAAGFIWAAIEDKRLAAQRSVVLVLNAIRTPWLALPPVVEAFRQRYGEEASRQGWAAIWVVGYNETFTERLDRAPGA